MTRHDRSGASDADERLDRTIRRAFSDELAAQPGDDDRIEAAIERTLLVPKMRSRPSWYRGRSPVYLVAAALAVGALAYAAEHRSVTTGSSATEAPAAEPSPVIEGTPGVSPPPEPASAAPAPIETASPETLPVPSVPVARPVRAAPPASARPTTNDNMPSANGVPSASTTLGPAELFARASEARRANETKRAIELYDELQTRFPDSREASTSRVALGRLLLDRADEPARARVSFDRYLAGDPSGPLAEEARAGRALALMRLGDQAAERAAWLELLERHPSSLHAERARQRLVVLGN